MALAVALETRDLSRKESEGFSLSTRSADLSVLKTEIGSSDISAALSFLASCSMEANAISSSCRKGRFCFEFGQNTIAAMQKVILVWLLSN